MEVWKPLEFVSVIEHHFHTIISVIHHNFAVVIAARQFISVPVMPKISVVIGLLVD